MIQFVAIALCAVISSAADFVSIANGAKSKREWLSEFLDLSAGSPSHDRFNAMFALLKPAIHMLSAWATANHISLGQVVVDPKRTEIKAISKRLELLQISGALVTIDALVCQTEIAQKVVSPPADSCLAVKGNQPTRDQGTRGHRPGDRQYAARWAGVPGSPV